MKEKVHKDFHGALSASFEFLSKRYGKEKLKKFLEICGKNIYKELINEIKENGLPAIEKYWEKIFKIEEAKFKIERDKDKIKLIIIECPALKHMEKVGYKIYGDFCIQCKVINKTIAKETGLISITKTDQNKKKCEQIFKKDKI